MHVHTCCFDHYILTSTFFNHSQSYLVSISEFSSSLGQGSKLHSKVSKFAICSNANTMLVKETIDS